MSNHGKIAGMTQLNQVIFKEKATAGVGTKFFSLFPGLGYAAGYKVRSILMRAAEYEGHWLTRVVVCRFSRGCTSTVASPSRGTTSRSTTAATSRRRLARRRARPSCTPLPEGELYPRSHVLANLSGRTSKLTLLSSIIGIGEIVLLPLDVLKIKRQTNPEAFRGRGVLKIIKDEGFGLYRGWGWTAARNAPGSFAVCSHPTLPHRRVKTTNTRGSSSVARPSPRNISSSSRTTTRPRGSRTSSPPSPVRRPRSSSRRRWTSSRPVSRTGTSTTRRAASGFCPTWPRRRACRASSRVSCPR